MIIQPPNTIFLNMVIKGDGLSGLVVSWVSDPSLWDTSSVGAKMLQVMSTNADNEKAAVKASSGYTGYKNLSSCTEKKQRGNDEVNVRQHRMGRERYSALMRQVGQR